MLYGLRFLPHREDAVNKAEFIEVLAAHFDGNKAEAGRALNAITETITYQAAGGEKVTITGFGVFEKVSRPARMVRNPRTGERKRAKATAVPRFRAGTDLKAYVSGAKKVPKASKKASAKTPAPQVTAAATTAGSDEDGCSSSSSRKGHSGHEGDHVREEGDSGQEGQSRKDCSRQERRSDQRPSRQEDRTGKVANDQEGRTREGYSRQEGNAGEGNGRQEGNASRRQRAAKKATPVKATTAKTAPAAVKKTPTKTTTTAKAVPAKTSRAKKATATS